MGVSACSVFGACKRWTIHRPSERAAGGPSDPLGKNDETMEKALTLFDTTIGKKAALAVSGLVLFGFVFVHMLGNLQVYQGPEVYNAYAATLKGNPALLWGTRITLLVALVVHVVTMVQLYSRAVAARPARYHQTHHTAASYSSVTMKFTGPLLFLYIVFHILHFTAPGLALGNYEHSHEDAYRNFINAFQVPWVTLVYVAANFFLALHLFHGAWSLMQSLGLSHPRYNVTRKTIAQILAFVITVGNVMMPVSVLIGLIE